MSIARVHLIHGNNEARVAEARFDLIRRLLPHGEADGEVVDIQGPGNQPLTLERGLGQILEELGAVSLIPGSRKVVIVHGIADLRDGSGRRASATASTRRKKSPGGAERALAELDRFIETVLPGTDNTLVFLYLEDDEKGRRVNQKSPLYELLRRRGMIQEHSEKRIDWQLEEAMMNGDLAGAVRLVREWSGRGGSAPFRIVTMLNGYIQLLLQFRLEAQARRDGGDAASLFPSDMRPSIQSIPDFKKRRLRGLALQTPLEAIRTALARLNEVQKSFFPTGEELVVHDPIEQVELLIAELLRSRTPA